MLHHCNFPGRTFGRLTVIEWRSPKWLCRCKCGTEVLVRADHLTSGATRSCGCLKRDTSALTLTTHGKSGTSTYTVWQGIIARCGNPNDPAYKHYGGRGI